MTFYRKYLKYKNKYLELKQSIGGAEPDTKNVPTTAPTDVTSIVDNDYINYAIASHGSVAKEVIELKKNITVITYENMGISLDNTKGHDMMYKIINDEIFKDNNEKQHFYTDKFKECTLSMDTKTGDGHFASGVYIKKIDDVGKKIKDKIIDIIEDTKLSTIIDSIVSYHLQHHSGKKIYIHCLFCLGFERNSKDSVKPIAKEIALGKAYIVDTSLKPINKQIIDDITKYNDLLDLYETTDENSYDNNVGEYIYDKETDDNLEYSNLKKKSDLFIKPLSIKAECSNKFKYFNKECKNANLMFNKLFDKYINACTILYYDFPDDYNSVDNYDILRRCNEYYSPQDGSP